MKDKVIFLPSDKRQIFPQIDTIILAVCVARHAQITQNNKITIFHNALTISLKRS